MIKNLFENEEQAREFYNIANICPHVKCPYPDRDCSNFCVIPNLKQAGAIRKSPLEAAREKTDEFIDASANVIKYEKFLELKRLIQSERQIVDAMIKEKE